LKTFVRRFLLTLIKELALDGLEIGSTSATFPSIALTEPSVGILLLAIGFLLVAASAIASLVHWGSWLELLERPLELLLLLS
jgi:hypothetical protein